MRSVACAGSSTATSSAARRAGAVRDRADPRVSEEVRVEVHLDYLGGLLLETLVDEMLL